MEAAPLHASQDRPFSHYKSHIRRNQSMGLLQAPPPPPLLYSHSGPHPYYSFQPPPQPPLLPLPAHPRRTSSVPGLSSRSPATINSPKKSKSPTKSSKEYKNSPNKRFSDTVTVSSSTIIPELAKVYPNFVSRGNKFGNHYNSIVPKIAQGSCSLPRSPPVLAISPPPSSLPLPTFLMRRKIGCKAETDGIDTGAASNLQRRFRL